MSGNATGNSSSSKRKRKREKRNTDQQLLNELLNKQSTTPPLAGRTRSADGGGRGGKGAQPTNTQLQLAATGGKSAAQPTRLQGGLQTITEGKGGKGAQPTTPRPQEATGGKGARQASTQQQLMAPQTPRPQAATGGKGGQSASPQQPLTPNPGGIGPQLTTGTQAATTGGGLANAFALADSDETNTDEGLQDLDDAYDHDSSDDEQTAHTLQLEHDTNKRQEEENRVTDFEKLMRTRDVEDQARRRKQDEEAKAHREKLEAESRNRIQLLEEIARQRLQCTTPTVDLTADAPGRTAGPPPWTPQFSLSPQTFERNDELLEHNDYERTDDLVTGITGSAVRTEQQAADHHKRLKLKQEADLRAKQLERVDNKKRDAAVRAKQEAEAHATQENLRRLQTAIAEKELGRTPESRTQKVPAHLMMRSENCQSVALVAAHLHKLNCESEKDRVSFLKQGAGDIPLTRDQEQMPWIELVPNVLRTMSPDYLQTLNELIISPKSRLSMALPEFLALKYEASTAVTTYQWLQRIEGVTATEDVGKATARMILQSLPADIRKQANTQLAGRKDKDTTIAIITAILENAPEAPAGLQPRYSTPTRRTPIYQPINDQYAAPVQGSPTWTATDVERMVSKALNDRLQTLSPAQEWNSQQAPWTPTQGEPTKDGQYENNLCYNCNEPGHKRFDCPHPKGKGGKGVKGGKGGKGGKGDKGKGGKGEQQNYTATPPPPLYAPAPPGPPPGAPPAHVADTNTRVPWPCDRCNDGTSHRLSNCPNYKGCEICGSKQHLQRRCPGQQAQPTKN